MRSERVLELHRRFSEARGNVLVGNQSLSVVKGKSFARLTGKGWLLFRSNEDDRGRFFAEHCTDDEALAFIEKETDPQPRLGRTGPGNGHKQRAREELYSAIYEAYGPGVRTEHLLEALDTLAS